MTGIQKPQHQLLKSEDGSVAEVGMEGKGQDCLLCWCWWCAGAFPCDSVLGSPRRGRSQQREQERVGLLSRGRGLGGSKPRRMAEKWGSGPGKRRMRCLGVDLGLQQGAGDSSWSFWNLKLCVPVPGHPLLFLDITQLRPLGVGELKASLQSYAISPSPAKQHHPQAVCMGALCSAVCLFLIQYGRMTLSLATHRLTRKTQLLTALAPSPFCTSCA